MWRLAQVNVAKMRAPLDDPLMAGFVARIAEINALADVSPGFVWRFQTAEGDATYVRPLPDPTILFNMSVWESAEALQQFVYRTSHGDVMRSRSDWFEPATEAYQAMWWVPGGHIPSVDEALQRLAYVREHGETAIAFSFRRRFPAPEAPARPQEEMCDSITYGGRSFMTRSNTPNGDAGDATVFRYSQDGRVVWATYEGGGIRFGSLVALADASGSLNVSYQHLSPADVVRTGRCTSTSQLLADGRLRLHEGWQWTSGDRSSGQSVLEEVLPI